MGKETLRALGREALRTGRKILADIAENPQANTQDIVSKHVTDSTQNIIKKLRGGGVRRRQKRKLRGGGMKRARKRVKVGKTIKRYFFLTFISHRYDHASDGTGFR